jgi:transposase, IS5 family
MVSLLYLKHAFDLSDEQLVERWSENVLWQFQRHGLLPAQAAVQEKAIAHPTDSRLLEVARDKIARLAKRSCGPSPVRPRRPFLWPSLF